VAGALNQLLPGGDYLLRMNLVPHFLPDGSTEILVLLGADAAVAGKLDVLIRAYDRVFTPVGDPIKQRLDVPAAAVAGSAEFQWTSVLKPPPGDYEVRAAVATADGRHVANVAGYIDLPDLKKDALALSGIVVKSGGAATLAREFAAGSAVELSFQVAGKAASSPVTVRYSLRDDAGQTLASIDVPQARAVRVSDTIESYEIGIRAPAMPGRYVAAIDVTDGRRATQRAVLFTVR